MKMIFHMLDMIVINSWLPHIRDTTLLDIARKNILASSDFKLHVAFALMEAGKVINKRGGLQLQKLRGGILCLTES